MTDSICWLRGQAYRCAASQSLWLRGEKVLLGLTELGRLGRLELKEKSRWKTCVSYRPIHTSWNRPTYGRPAWTTSTVTRRRKWSAPKSGRWVIAAPGGIAFPAAAMFAAGKRGEELREHMGKGYEASRPSGWDPTRARQGPGYRRRAGRGAVHQQRPAAVWPGRRRASIWPAFASSTTGWRNTARSIPSA